MHDTSVWGVKYGALHLKMRGLKPYKKPDKGVGTEKPVNTNFRMLQGASKMGAFGVHFSTLISQGC